MAKLGVRSAGDGGSVRILRRKSIHSLRRYRRRFKIISPRESTRQVLSFPRHGYRRRIRMATVDSLGPILQVQSRSKVPLRTCTFRIPSTDAEQGISAATKNNATFDVGDVRKWIAFIAVVLRLFFVRHFPGMRCMVNVL